MIAIVAIAAAAAAAALSIVLVVTRPEGTHRLLRWAALGLTVAVAAALTPYTISDSGAVAALYLLGVPVLGAGIPVLAGLADRGVLLAEAVGAIVVFVWSALLSLGGLGVAFLPSALLLIATVVSDLLLRASRTT